MAKKTTQKAKKSVKKTPSKKKVKVGKPSFNIDKLVPETNQFVLGNGRKLGSVRQLIEELEKMDDELYANHVNWQKNDFSNWLNDVFKQEEIALEIQHSNNRLETQRRIMKMIIDKR